MMTNIQLRPDSMWVVAVANSDCEFVGLFLMGGKAILFELSVETMEVFYCGFGLLGRNFKAKRTQGFT